MVCNSAYGTISAGTGVVDFFVNIMRALCVHSFRIVEMKQRNLTKNSCKQACLVHTLLILAFTLSSLLLVFSPNVRRCAFRPSTHSWRIGSQDSFTYLLTLSKPRASNQSMMRLNASSSAA